MKVLDLIRKTDLNHTLLLGYYGGGNYGDELLLEVLLNLFSNHHVKDLMIYYQNPQVFSHFHHDFGYKVVDARNRFRLLKLFFTVKNIVVGGGGIWGLDFNKNVFALTCLMLIIKIFTRKQVFLLSVGYYSSTSWLGHISAWMAAKAATAIIARDQETFDNFQKYSRQVYLEKDLSSYLPELSLKAYEAEAQQIRQALPIHNSTIFATIRRFQKKYHNNYNQALFNTITKHPERHFILSILEPKEVDPEGYALITKIAKVHPNIAITDFSFNPLALYLYLCSNRNYLKVIAPQYHAIISAYLCGIKFLPIVYDNKVAQFLNEVDHTSLSINDITSKSIDNFITDGEK